MQPDHAGNSLSINDRDASKRASRIVHSNSGSKSSLIIYDWDDTILPTSWLRSLGFLSNNISDMVGTPPPILPVHIASVMRLIEEATIENLRVSMSLGRVIIITNSSVLWVPFTAKRFFPRLSEIIESGFEVYSARPALVENGGPNYVYLPSMAVTWKTDKFREMIGNVQYPTCISVGDGFAERCAVLALADKRRSGKAVRIPLQPNGSLLLEQLRLMASSLPHVVRDNRTGDLYLNSAVPGSYRLIPVQASLELSESSALPIALSDQPQPLVEVKEDESYEQQTLIVTDESQRSSAGLMQSLANGIAFYGKSISHRISLSSSNNSISNRRTTVTQEVKQTPSSTTVTSSYKSESENLVRNQRSL